MYCTGEDRRGYRILFAAKVGKRVTDVGVKGGTSMKGARGGFEGEGCRDAAGTCGIWEGCHAGGQGKVRILRSEWRKEEGSEK